MRRKKGVLAARRTRPLRDGMLQGEALKEAVCRVEELRSDLLLSSLHGTDESLSDLLDTTLRAKYEFLLALTCLGQAVQYLRLAGLTLTRELAETAPGNLAG